MNHKAFTLIELIVTIAIIAILISITLPILSSAKQTSSELICVAHIRNASLAITNYADENRGSVPFAGYKPQSVTNPANESITVGGQTGFAYGQWVNIMPEYWNGNLWSKSMTCPDQPDFDPELNREWPEVNMLTDGFRRQPFFNISAAFHLSPSSLKHDIPIETMTVQPQKLHNVMYPSSKSLLYEFFGFCLEPNPDTLYWQSIAQTQLFATSAVAVDGSAFRYAVRNAIKPINGIGLSFTTQGINGQDFDHALINQDAIEKLHYATWDNLDE
jgi:prepilin-type N-terminal cleavage/methylation domain-containing protein